MITFEFDGIDYGGFIQCRIEKSLENISGQFFIEFAANVVPFPVKVGQTVVVKIDNTSIINGFVEDLDGSARPDGHVITVSGRDKTADLIDSTLSEALDFTFPITLEDVCRNVIQSLGADINVINEISGLEPFNDYVTSSLGVRAFEFIEAYAQKRQVLLTSNGNGDLVITRSSGIETGILLQNRLTGNVNNIKSINWRLSNKDRFNRYIVHSQGNPSITAILTELGVISPDSLQDTNADAFDNSIRRTRIKHIIANSSSDIQECKNTAIWHANINRARGLMYSCMVQGFYFDQNKSIWTPNILVNVIDDFADINSSLLINQVVFSQSLDSGSTTQLNLVSPDAYTLEPNLSTDLKKSSTLFEEFFEG